MNQSIKHIFLLLIIIAIVVTIGCKKEKNQGSHNSNQNQSGQSDFRDSLVGNYYCIVKNIVIFNNVIIQDTIIGNSTISVNTSSDSGIVVQGIVFTSPTLYNNSHIAYFIIPMTSVDFYNYGDSILFGIGSLDALHQASTSTVYYGHKIH